MNGSWFARDALRALAQLLYVPTHADRLLQPDNMAQAGDDPLLLLKHLVDSVTQYAQPDEADSESVHAALDCLANVSLVTVPHGGTGTENSPRAAGPNRSGHARDASSIREGEKKAEAAAAGGAGSTELAARDGSTESAAVEAVATMRKQAWAVALRTFKSHWRSFARGEPSKVLAAALRTLQVVLH